MHEPSKHPISETLARFAADLTYETLPDGVAARARALTLDLCGSIVRAGHEADSTPSLFAAVETLGLGAPGPSRVVGSERSFAPPIAALVNGMLGHSLDFDDTHADSSLHPSAPVVSAAFAVGEAEGASGQEIVAAIVAGYEVCCRLGMALDPAAHYARGFHPTATAGTFGAAAAAAKLYGLNADGVLAAFGVAGSQAAGSLQFLENGAWNKRWQVGQAGMNGVLAAALARSGFRAAAEPIEGRHGFLVGYTDAPDFEKATAGLGEVFETLRIGVKPYPGCRYTHAALDGLAQLRREHGLVPSEIDRIEVGLHRNGLRLVGEPIAEKRRARSIVEAQFSMPFAAAVMLSEGRLGWDDYELIGNAAIDTLAGRLEVFRDESLEGLGHPFGATLRLETSKGAFRARIPDPSGEPDSFPDEAALRAKFLGLAEPVLGAEAAGLADHILRLGEKGAARAPFAA